MAVSGPLRAEIPRNTENFHHGWPGTHLQRSQARQGFCFERTIEGITVKLNMTFLYLMQCAPLSGAWISWSIQVQDKDLYC